MIDMSKIGKFILKLRKFKGLTQNELATNLNLSHQAVSKWENGTTIPDIEALIKISKEFGITIDDILSKGLNNLGNLKTRSDEESFIRDILNEENITPKGLLKVNFSPKLVIFSEINKEGETKIKEITTPVGYTAIRGDGFTDAFPFNKFNFDGEREQKIPVINLSFQELHYYNITFMGKEEIELPDKVIVKANHFYLTEERKKGSISIKCDTWIDENGIMLLSKIVHKNSCEITYHKSYLSNKNNGSIVTLENGQYFSESKWENLKNKENMTFNIETTTSKLSGGFGMKIEYILDENYNPISYIETWKR